MLPGEVPLSEYTEPLWRRIAAPDDTDRARHRRLRTRRTQRARPPARPRCRRHPVAQRPLSGSVPDPSRGIGTGCRRQRHLERPRGRRNRPAGEFVPRLSADGYTVAFLSRAEPIGAGEFFDQQREQGEQADIYVADMHEGLTRDGSADESHEHRWRRRKPNRRRSANSRCPTTAVTWRSRRGVPSSVSRSRRFVSPPAAEPGLDELFYADLGRRHPDPGHAGPRRRSERTAPRAQAT